jgi:hypothetical protein
VADLSPPWILFCDGGAPIAILPAGRPGEVLNVEGWPLEKAEALVAAANQESARSNARMTERLLELGAGAVRRDGSKLLGLLEHAVGKNGYRNYYAAAPGDDDLELLVGLRLAVRGRVIPGGLCYYYVSVSGVAMLRALHPKRYKSELKGVPS